MLVVGLLCSKIWYSSAWKFRFCRLCTKPEPEKVVIFFLIREQVQACEEEGGRLKDLIDKQLSNL